MKNCIDAAVRQGTITLEEGEALKKRYDAIAKKVFSTGDAKETLLKEIEVEAAERKRRALLTETARDKLVKAMHGYRNLKGEADLAEAFLMMHENFGRTGAFVQDAEGLRSVIQRKAHADLAELLMEFKRGAIRGDLRRMSGATRARMENVVRELFGEATGDERAKALAEIWTKVTEELRLRFNDAGGAIQKLERWGLPQGHDPLALLDYGKARWIEYMMGDGVLDRERTVHPLTRRAMSDEEMRESLGVIWERITTDGMIDKEVTGQPMGRGALWSQHADHRFLHFKSADAWLKYAKEFGNQDPFAAMMQHINVMARDIAQMETFGPNPQVLRTYLKNYLSKQVALIKPMATVLAEQTAQLKELAGKLNSPNPNHVKIIDRIAEIHGEMEAIRRKYSPQLGAKPSRRNRAKLDALHTELQSLEDQLQPFALGEKPILIEDEAIRVAMQKLLEEMRDPIVFANRRRPHDYLSSMIYTADARWELMRGSLTPVNASFANVMASTRNLLSAAKLGSAWLSSLTDAAFGQDARLRFGMGMSKANFGRTMVLVLQDMLAKLGEDITRGMVQPATRDWAVRAGLGLDSAIDTMHRAARQNQSWDGRAWTGFLSERVLTLGLLLPWTQSGKHLVGLDLMGFMADLSKTPFAELPKNTQRALRSHGFDARAWDQIRQAPLHEPKEGARLLRGVEIEQAVGRELAERYIGMILRETRYAVPESSVSSRAFLSGTRPGTILGEVNRSAVQFKGFGIAVVQLHAARIAREMLAGDRSAAGYAAALLVTSTFLGAIAMALKDIKDGRDPRKWIDEKTYLDPAFWGAAALQSGGFGIYGDFLFSNTGRTGKGLPVTLAGPTVDVIDDVLGMTVGNAAKAMRGQKTTVGRDAVNLAAKNVPGSNLFYLGLIYQRVLLERLQALADPAAQAAANRSMQLHRRRDFNQEFWWPPGAPAPTRAPDLTRPFATR